MRANGIGSTLLAVIFAVGLGLAACGSDGGKTPSKSDGSSSSSNCTHTYECINGACTCTTKGKEQQSCCNPESCGASDSKSCATVCEVCS